MKYTNHNSNRFMPTTDNIGQSLVNDAWTIVNKTDLFLGRWQDAADDGYGLAPWWGEATDLFCEGFDWFCVNILRNLVAIAVYVALIVGYVGQRLHERYIATGKAEAHAKAVAFWIKETATPWVLRSLDRICAFMLCYEEPKYVERTASGYGLGAAKW